MRDVDVSGQPTDFHNDHSHGLPTEPVTMLELRQKQCVSQNATAAIPPYSVTHSSPLECHSTGIIPFGSLRDFQLVFLCACGTSPFHTSSQHAFFPPRATAALEFDCYITLAFARLK